MKKHPTYAEREQRIDNIVTMLSELTPKQMEYVIQEAAKAQLSKLSQGEEEIRHPCPQDSQQS